MLTLLVLNGCGKWPVLREHRPRVFETRVPRKTGGHGTVSSTMICNFHLILFGCLDICLAVHRSITLLLLPAWYINFLFIHINYIKLNSSTCFERIPPIIRRFMTQVVHMQPLVSSLSAGDCLVHLQRVTMPEAAYVQFASLTSCWWAECAQNMYRNLIYSNLCKLTKKFVLSSWLK